VRDVDVVKFGARYCPQNRRAAEALAEIQAAVRRTSRRPGAANAAITRLLRHRGLVVLTRTSVRTGPMFGRQSMPGQRA
jgi:hypothetical protein